MLCTGLFNWNKVKEMSDFKEIIHFPCLGSCHDVQTQGQQGNKTNIIWKLS